MGGGFSNTVELKDQLESAQVSGDRREQWRRGAAKYRERQSLTHERVCIYIDKKAMKALRKRSVGSGKRFGVWLSGWIAEQAE